MNAIERAAKELEEFCSDHKAATCGRSVPRAATFAAILRKHFAEPAERPDITAFVDACAQQIVDEDTSHSEVKATVGIHMEALADWLCNRSAERADQWRTIESAPKDGTQIILGGEGYSEPGFWMGDLGWWFETGEDVLHHPFQPTHWQPLPVPPQEQANG